MDKLVVLFSDAFNVLTAFLGGFVKCFLQIFPILFTFTYDDSMNKQERSTIWLKYNSCDEEPKIMNEHFKSKIRIFEKKHVINEMLEFLQILHTQGT